MKTMELSLFIGKCNKKVVEKYRIITFLGEGTFSQVFLCEHRVTGIQRVIKRIFKNRFTKDLNESIMNEIKILSKMDHLNILKIIEYFEDEHNIFLITEYLEGGELYDRLIEKKNFSELNASKILKQILSAVSYMHNNGIIHRDLKLENIMFEEKEDDDLELKIIDFGTSRRIQTNESLSAFFGTPYYMAPEIFKKNYDNKCDVWSCGVILYIILSGKPPFDGNTDLDTEKKILEGKFDFPHNEWKYISYLAKDLISKMLIYDPKKRPNAAECLKHPFFHRNNILRDDINNYSEIVTNMMDFKTKYTFQKAIFIYLSNFLEIKEEKKRLKKLFKKVDTDENGEITKDELYDMYSKFYNRPVAEKIVNQILENIDFNKGKTIDFSEFCTANYNYKKLINDEKIKEIFMMIDTEQNGHITENDLNEFFHFTEIKEEKKFVKDMINEVDEKKTGKISFNSFKIMMKKFIE